MEKKKLYYLPGIISIIGLPVLLFFWGPKDRSDFVVVKMNLPSTNKSIPNEFKFTTDYVYDYLKTKKLETINLQYFVWDKQSFSFTSNLNFAVSEIARLQSAGDTSAALKIKLNSQSTYSDFMHLQNQALIHDYKRYALVDDAFYFFPHHPPRDTNMAEFEPIQIDMSLFSKSTPVTKWQLFKSDLQYKWWDIERRFAYLFYHQQQNKLLAGGFFLLIFIPALVKIRKHISISRRANVNPTFT